jgi:predicted murein hydrolase (TIGR00659 family)
MTEFVDIWVYLSTSPLLWLTVTLVAYAIADRVARALNRHPLANPVVIAVALVITALSVSNTPFDTYFDGAQFVHFLLGPATVALAVPLVENLAKVRRALLPMAAALIAGSLTAIVSAVGVAALMGAPAEILASLAPKSVTTPIAMGVAERLGGIPTLTAVLVISTGIIGAMIVTPLMNLLRVRDYAARGFAVGIAAHGIGTARAFQVDPVAGTFAGLAMGLNGVVTAVLAPFIATLW